MFYRTLGAAALMLMGAGLPANVEIRSGTAPVCAALQAALSRDSDMLDGPQAVGPIEKIAWANSDETLPPELSGSQESRFDLDNDGVPDRVFTKYFEDRYMRGSVLLLRPGTAPSDWWFLPCQLDAKGIAFDKCPPLSQQSDEAGFSMQGRNRRERVFFRARYTKLTPFRFAGTTFVAATSQTPATASYVGIIKAIAGRKYQPTCLLEVFKKR